MCTDPEPAELERLCRFYSSCWRRPAFVCESFADKNTHHPGFAVRASPGSPADPLPAQLGQSRDRRSLLASSRQVFVVSCGDQKFPGLRSETDRGVLHPHLVPLPGTDVCHPEAFS